QAKNLGKRDLTTSVLTSSAMAGLRDEGNKLAAKMAQMRTEYGPNHPDVQALQSQIDANKAAQAATQSDYSSANSSDIVVATGDVDALEKAVA
ncbi:hypothetical protein, partial [Acinetobacter baumannii]|uniref:hypothetical protein n=1 Tax=Acinetobacter baumannii TaxID=470 RepID=UPI00147EF368